MAIKFDIKAFYDKRGIDYITKGVNVKKSEINISSEFYVYGLCWPDTLLPFYIGAGSSTRYEDHNSTNVKELRRNQLKTEIVGILQTRKTPHIVRFFKENLTRESSFELERFYVNKYGRLDLGTGILTNKTAGGHGFKGLSSEIYRANEIRRSLTYKTSEEAKQKQSISAQRRPRRTKEFKKKLSKILMGKNKGKVHSKEQNEFIGQVLKNRVKHLQKSGKYKSKVAKLTEEDVKNIRTEYLKENIKSATFLVVKYNVTRQNILYILRGHTWKNAKGSKHLIPLCLAKVQKLGVGSRR